ncbi:hypothetical protein SAMN05443573_10175 [Celeribacter indicus]|nr:hypothetical protein SAMN05443573_10175 [Celeribacter indicus]
MDMIMTTAFAFAASAVMVGCLLRSSGERLPLRIRLDSREARRRRR